MQCSTEEIAEKKRQAIERLKEKKRNSAAADNNNSTSPGASTKSSSTFYGNAITNKVSELNEYENKIKNTSNQATTNYRILSQPYPHRNPNNNENQSSNAFDLMKSSVNRSANNSFVSSTCSMISTDRFQVEVAGFHEKLNSVFKTIPSRNFDPETKIWSFGLTEYDLVQERVSKLHPYVTIGKLPKFVLDLLRKPKNDLDFSCLQAIEKKLSSQLLEFQKYGVAFGISHKGKCLIADDMGLGKTFEAIAIADFYRDDWPLLIVTTLTARDAWLKHVKDLLPSVPAQSIKCLTSTKDYVGDCNVLITSYSLMEKNCDRLLEIKFGFIILDESHTIKNFKTKSSQSAKVLGEKAKRLILLSGTPALSRPAELYTQLELIDKYLFGSFKDYSFRYCNGKQTRFGLDSNGQSNLKELNVILKHKFMIRRTKADVEFELGEKSRETILLDKKKIWDQNNEDLRETIENCSQYSEDVMRLRGAEREEVLLRLYAETAKLKASAVCSYIKGLVEKKQKFIVFAYHQVMLNAISNCLKKLDVDFIRIDGTTKKELRSIYIDRFQNNKQCQVAVLSLKACNAAITLTAASLVIFSELDWNPSTLAQCEARAHRIGQKSAVICRYLLAQGTVDDYIWEMVKQKQNVLNKAGIFSEDLSDTTMGSFKLSQQINDCFDGDGASTSKQHGDIVDKNIETAKVDADNEVEPDRMDLDQNDSYKHMLDDDEEDAFMLDIDC